MYIDAHMHIKDYKGTNSCAFLHTNLNAMAFDIKSNYDLLALKCEHNVNIFLGLHPLFFSDYKSDLTFLQNLFTNTDKDIYKGIGEIGFDKRSKLSIDECILLFEYQLLFAIEQKKPVSLHVYKTHDVLLKVLNKHKGKLKHINLCLHNAILSDDLIKAYSSFDMFFSLGSYLIKGHKKIESLLNKCSRDRILLESDFDLDFSLYKNDTILNIYKALAAFYKEDIDTIQDSIENNFINFCKS